MNKNILIIDDDKGILEVVKIILQENNYGVATISDNDRILEKIKDIKPDLILLDVWMSGIDGREIVKMIHADDELKKIPVILVSALTNVEEIAREAQATDFLAKPFEITDLLDKIKKHTS